jgi:drug/metabolite transporter (DMT)-like permease
MALMLAASIMYAIHLPINQRVLWDIPAPTVTLYTLLAMSAVVIPAYLLFDRAMPAPELSWTPVIGLTIVTFASRLTLFLGVKKIGGLQTAILGLSELLVSLVVSHLWLHESLNLHQWLGAAALALSLFLVGFDQIRDARHLRGGLLGWVQPPQPPELSWGPHE